jgi:hypothetical protein
MQKPAAVRAVRSILPGRSSDFGSRGKHLPSRLNNQWQKPESIQAFTAQTIPVTALGTFRTWAFRPHRIPDSPAKAGT